MKNIILILFSVFVISPLGLAAPIEPKVLLERIDKNLASKNMISISSFMIHSPRGSRTIKAKSWVEGRARSFTEYLAPAREKGVKMLKLDNQLWTYYPRADRIVKIAGHMLRQPVMGSDLSYEDMLENQKLLDRYDAVYEKEEQFQDRMCWVLQLNARQSNLPYQQRKIWVDQERFIPLKEELSTKRGKLLKIIEIREVFQVQDRWYPKKMWFKDALKQGKGTEIIIHEIQFDIPISQSRFSKSALRR